MTDLEPSPVTLNSFQGPSCPTLGAPIGASVLAEKWTLKQVQGDGDWFEVGHGNHNPVRFCNWRMGSRIARMMVATAAPMTMMIAGSSSASAALVKLSNSRSR